MDARRDQVTSLLLAWREGDEQALEQLMPMVFSELHGLARAYFQREPSSHTLQATALINELYLRLVDQNRIDWRNRAQFIGVAGQMMRRILVDHFRARSALKRGGDLKRLTLTDIAAEGGEMEVDLVALDEALSELEQLDPQEAKVIELRFFAGMTVVETAAVLDISTATVKREWASAKAWLWQRLNSA